jgi:hypothetical protein
MNEQLTKEEFVALVDAYLGAREHERWVYQQGDAAAYRLAVAATQAAREALIEGAGHEL